MSQKWIIDFCERWQGFSGNVVKLSKVVFSWFILARDVALVSQRSRVNFGAKF